MVRCDIVHLSPPTPPKGLDLPRSRKVSGVFFVWRFVRGLGRYGTFLYTAALGGGQRQKSWCCCCRSDVFHSQKTSRSIKPIALMRMLQAMAAFFRVVPSLKSFLSVQRYCPQIRFQCLEALWVFLFRLFVRDRCRNDDVIA